MEDFSMLYVVKECCIMVWKGIICESNSQVGVTLLNEKFIHDVYWHLSLAIMKVLNLCGSLEYVTFIHIMR